MPYKRVTPQKRSHDKIINTVAKLLIEEARNERLACKRKEQISRRLMRILGHADPEEFFEFGQVVRKIGRFSIMSVVNHTYDLERLLEERGDEFKEFIAERRRLVLKNSKQMTDEQKKILKGYAKEVRAPTCFIKTLEKSDWV